MKYRRHYRQKNRVSESSLIETNFSSSHTADCFHCHGIKDKYITKVDLRIELYILEHYKQNSAIVNLIKL